MKRKLTSFSAPATSRSARPSGAAWRARFVVLLAALGASGCRNQVVSVHNESKAPVTVSVARGFSGVVTVPPGARAELQARLRPGPVEIVLEARGSSSALICEHAGGSASLHVHIGAEGAPECTSVSASSSDKPQAPQKLR